jgi:ribose transport system ATP-binding protein
VLVLYAGRLVAEIGSSKLTEGAIMRPALGHDSHEKEAAA